MRATALVLVSLVVLMVSTPSAIGVSLDIDASSVSLTPCAPAPADRSIAQTVWFQGFLADEATGDPVNATYDIVAQMYSAPTGGTSLWGPETHAAAPVIEGWFNIELGTIVTLPAFSAPPYYLQLTVNGEVLAPRLKLASVPSSLRAQTAEGAPADGDWTIAGNDIYSSVSGNVGVGDSSPNAKLDVFRTGGGTAISAHSDGLNAYGVYAEAFGTSTVYGIFATSDSTAIHGRNEFRGTYGSLGTTQAAVVGSARDNPGDAEWAGYFLGRVYASGGLSIGSAGGTTSGISVGKVNPLLELAGSGAAGTSTSTVRLSTAAGHQGSFVVRNDGEVSLENEGDSDLRLGSGSAGTISLAIGTANVVRVSSSGDVGIGNTDPSSKLDVDGIVRVRGNTWPSADTGASMELAYNPATHRGYVQVYDRDAGGGWGQLYLGDGNVGIGAATGYAYKLDVAGDIQCVALHETSDDRLKTNVRELEGALEALEGLRGVSFEWNGLAETAAGAKPGEKQIGVLASDVQRVYPELVSCPEGSYKSVDYTKLTAVLIEAVKELREENRALESRVEELERAAR